MNITFVCPRDTPSGGMRVIALYAAKLASRGHNVIAVLPREPPPSLREQVSSLVRRRAWIQANKPYAISFFRNVPFKVRWLEHSGPVTDRDVPDADVVVATWWITAEWVWALGKSKGMKLHFMQDYEVWWASPEVVPRVDAVYALPIPKIVIAKWVWRLLETKWGQTPIAFVPNSVDTEVFFAPPRGKQKVPSVGLTYSTVVNKGCDVSLAAIERARRHLPNLRVVSFGATAPPSNSLLRLETEFHVAVPDNQLRDLYASCDAWLFGTRKEGFGLPILEAMACRTPVIGTPAGAGEDLISKGGGVLVPIDDDRAMADAIISVANMSDLMWRSVSDIALHTATGYTWEDATDKFEASLKELVI